jgi:serine/threonine protein kinase
MSHENILRIFARCDKSSSLILEYHPKTLCSIIYDSSELGLRMPTDNIRKFTHDILSGLEYMHSLLYIHRDLKPDNILVSKNNERAIISDFGITRKYIKDAPLTPNMVTLNYRPPEMLNGANLQGAYVDMWSVGCILAEMHLGRYIFSGNEITIFQDISKKMGWAWGDDILYQSLFNSKLCHTNPAQPMLNTATEANLEPETKVESDFKITLEKNLDDLSLKLFLQLLKFDYHNRLSAECARNHEYFSSLKLKKIKN